jgi:hypothetical protein
MGSSSAVMTVPPDSDGSRLSRSRGVALQPSQCRKRDRQDREVVAMGACSVGAKHTENECCQMLKLSFFLLLVQTAVFMCSSVNYLKLTTENGKELSSL